MLKAIRDGAGEEGREHCMGHAGLQPERESDARSHGHHFDSSAFEPICLLPSRGAYVYLGPQIELLGGRLSPSWLIQATGV